MKFDHNNFLVRPRSWESIDQDAMIMRETYDLQDVTFMPVIELLEHVLCNELNEISLELVEDGEAQGFEGCTALDGKTIYLRNSVYIGAYKDQARHRFTVAHELGHAVLHAGQTPTMAFLSNHPDKPFCQSEPQANRFAASLLVPLKLLKPTDDELAVSSRFGVSKSTARIRLKEYREKILGESKFQF